MESGYERIAEAIEVKIRLLKKDMKVEQEYQNLLKELDDSYIMGVSVGREMRMKEEIAYLERLVGELLYG